MTTLTNQIAIPDSALTIMQGVALSIALVLVALVAASAAVYFDVEPQADVANLLLGP